MCLSLITVTAIVYSQEVPAGTICFQVTALRMSIFLLAIPKTVNENIYFTIPVPILIYKRMTISFTKTITNDTTEVGVKEREAKEREAALGHVQVMRGDKGLTGETAIDCIVPLMVCFRRFQDLPSLHKPLLSLLYHQRRQPPYNQLGFHRFL